MSAIVAAIGGLIGGAGAGSILTSFVGRLLVSVAASALMSALAPKPALTRAGLRTEQTRQGGDQPASFILGRYATAGSELAPPMSHGTVGGSPRGYLTYVHDLGDRAGMALRGLWINGNWHTVTGTAAAAGANYGFEVAGTYAGWVYVKFYDGSQTAADAGLLSKYGSYPERPWSSDMVGEGMCYGIVTFRYNRSLFSGFPTVLWELDGIPLYDPRKDSTAGGSGAHRWATPSTWERSANAALIVYNVLRGIPLDGGDMWGGGIPAADLPYAAWAAAMTACDAAVDDGDGGTEPAWRAGIEVGVDVTPADVLTEIMRGAGIQLAEIGGVWDIRVGGPGLPAYVLTDDAVLISRPDEAVPFPALDRTINAVHATWPDPAQAWATSEAEPLLDAAAEAEDGGRRLPADLALPTVPWEGQVQRVMAAYLAEERRFRRHVLSLPPTAAILAPLDSLAWTSAEAGYSAKVFEVTEVADDLHSCVQQVALRERDAGDWTPVVPTLQAAASSGEVIPAAQSVPGFAATGTTILDAAGTSRLPAIKLTWTGADQDDVTALRWQLRRAATSTVLLSGSTAAYEDGELVLSAGLLPQLAYEVRARPVVASRATTWTAWTAVTTPAASVVQVPLLPIDVDVITSTALGYTPRHPGRALVHVLGAGAAGAVASTDGTREASASGGGAGAYASLFLPAIETIGTIDITVGAGGAGKSASGSSDTKVGSHGGTTSFVAGSISLSCQGGRRGVAGVSPTWGVAAGANGGTPTLSSAALAMGAVGYPGGASSDVLITGNGKAATGGAAPDFGLEAAFDGQGQNVTTPGVVARPLQADLSIPPLVFMNLVVPGGTDGVQNPTSGSIASGAAPFGAGSGGAAGNLGPCASGAGGNGLVVIVYFGPGGGI